MEQACDVADESPPARPAPAAKPRAGAPPVEQSRPARAPAIGLPPGYRARPRSKQAQVRFAISPKMMLLIGAFIVIPTVIWIVKAGPVRARDQWQVLEPQARKDIEDVVDKALADREEAAWQGFVADLGSASEGGGKAVARPRYVPRVNTLLIDSPTFMWNVPEKVPFQGRIGQFMIAGISAAGKPQLMDLRGVYYTRARRVEAEMQMDHAPVNVRGRIVAGAVVME
jgi:hypothetical protein